jgi:hypothetical protein
VIIHPWQSDINNLRAHLIAERSNPQINPAAIRIKAPVAACGNRPVRRDSSSIASNITTR